MKTLHLLCAGLCVLAGCSSQPPLGERNRELALRELERREVSFDIVGLENSTRRAQDDGAYLFEEAGFFRDTGDAAFKALLLHLAKTRNHGLRVVLERHPRDTRYPASELQHALDEAVREGATGAASLLLEYRGQPGDETLFHAAYRNDAALARLLLEAGASFEEGENAEAIGMAARLGNLQTLKGFVESGKAPQQQVAQSILPAALTEKIDVVRYLVEHGVDVDQADSDGCTPLHYLAQDGTVDMVAYLLDQGADINKACRGKQTPLRWAGYGSNQPVIDFLVERGAVVH
ncbi:ankyrin repeat protein [Luteimonas cucumeris]|uniref:Ankyrin repeat protein n=1 Tax=Luteimonas cucumeris TaxID=985012 RepID=A0A562L6Z6_9GAMM|nr:ankyrin repeat domain-containing protein [Luteimonas cucumeris]TWI03408.1 ankyrin repeat protein [Luteimonas cucumeris]